MFAHHNPAVVNLCWLWEKSHLALVLLSHHGADLWVQECLQKLLDIRKAELQTAAHDRQLQDVRRVRRAQSALQTLLEEAKEDEQLEDPKRRWQLVV